MDLQNWIMPFSMVLLVCKTNTYSLSRSLFLSLVSMAFVALNLHFSNLPILQAYSSKIHLTVAHSEMQNIENMI